MSASINNNIQKLKENIFYRSKLFLEANGVLTPFGAKVINAEIKDVIIYDDSELITTELIHRLKDNFAFDIKNKKCSMAVVAYDVTVTTNNSDGLPERRDAICILISENGINWIEEYFPYLIIDGQCIFR